MKKGFALIELIIVVLIVGMSMALLSPSLSRLSKTTELRATTQKIAAILRHSRSEAVNKGRVYQVLLHPELREVQVRWMKLHPEEKEGGEENGMPSLPAYAFPEGILIGEVDLKAAQFGSDLPAIEFYPNGGSNGGSFLLKGEAQPGYRITIHFLTGMVEIKKV